MEGGGGIGGGGRGGRGGGGRGRGGRGGGGGINPSLVAVANKAMERWGLCQQRSRRRPFHYFVNARRIN